MANFTIKFYSTSLNRPVEFLMYAPFEQKNNPEQADNPYYGREMKTLFLLHGYCGGAENWVPTYLADKYNFAVVIPNGENGFWVDGISTGHAYGTFLGKELLGFVRDTFGLAQKREDTFVMGYSMGGFGAIHTGLAYPESFGKVVGLSSAMIIDGVATMTDHKANSVANYEYYRECFGDAETVTQSDKNPEVLVKKLKAEGTELPEIYMSCGDVDFLLEANRKFHEFLVNQGVEHTYIESPGDHNMEFWNEYVLKFVPQIFG